MIALFCVSIIGAAVIDMESTRVQARVADFHVVIDAGHGGRDGGAISKNGTRESDINLKIAKYLVQELTARGVCVTMTRTDENSLESPFARNRKQSDMKAREDIINKVQPNLMVSIHLNNFTSDRSVRGLQCFYAKGSEVSKVYAETIQAEFNQNIQYNNRRAMTGDYFILECTAYPSVLVECGFLSNTQEELMLKTAEYQKILAHYIATAIMKIPNSNFQTFRN